MIRIIHNILTALDGSTKEETKAVLVQMIDWNSDFDRQCHKLGILSKIPHTSVNLILSKQRDGCQVEWQNV